MASLPYETKSGPAAKGRPLQLSLRKISSTHTLLARRGGNDVGGNFGQKFHGT